MSIDTLIVRCSVNARLPIESTKNAVSKTTPTSPSGQSVAVMVAKFSSTAMANWQSIELNADSSKIPLKSVSTATVK